MEVFAMLVDAWLQLIYLPIWKLTVFGLFGFISPVP